MAIAAHGPPLSRVFQDHFPRAGLEGEQRQVCLGRRRDCEENAPAIGRELRKVMTDLAVLDPRDGQLIDFSADGGHAP